MSVFICFSFHVIWKKCYKQLYYLRSIKLRAKIDQIYIFRETSPIRSRDRDLWIDLWTVNLLNQKGLFTDYGAVGRFYRHGSIFLGARKLMCVAATEAK